MKKIPIGIDDFKKIRENNYYYIDKNFFYQHHLLYNLYFLSFKL